MGYWNEDLFSPFLKNIDYKFVPNKLYSITGRVGSGKSALIGAMLH